MVICLEQGAGLHTAQLMPLALTVSCFAIIQIGFTFLELAYPGSPGKRAVKRVCVCVCAVFVFYRSRCRFGCVCGRRYVENRGTRLDTDIVTLHCDVVFVLEVGQSPTERAGAVEMLFSYHQMTRDAGDGQTSTSTFSSRCSPAVVTSTQPVFAAPQRPAVRPKHYYV